MIHYLKIKDNYLKRLIEGTKKCEIRCNDRDYQLGDILKFCNPWEPYQYVEFKITHIHSGLGLEANYVALSVSKL